MWLGCIYDQIIALFLASNMVPDISLYASHDLYINIRSYYAVTDLLANSGSGMVPFMRLTIMRARLSIYLHYKVWHEINYPFPNFKSAAIEDW